MRKYSLTIHFMTSILAFAFFLSGCAKDSVTVKDKPISRLTSYSTEIDYLKLMEERLDKIETFQGSGKLKISNSTKSDSATGVIIIKKPDAFRLESFSFFGQAILYFASKRDSFSIFIPKENKYFKGKNTLENVQKVLPLDFSIEDFSHYVLGEFKKNDEDSVVIKFLEDHNIYKIYFYGEETKVLWFDPEFLVITKCTVFDADNELKSIINYSKFKEIDGIMFPMSVLIKFPYLDAKIEINYEDISLNEKIKNDLFHLEIPKDAKVINLDSEKVF